MGQLNTKPVTIKDIANRLNIHYTTVSRALRDHPDVNPETKTKILETAKMMNYRPNFVAKNLKNPKTNLLGVIVPEIKHSFFSAVISGIEEIASKAGYVILLCQSNEDYHREIENVNALISSKVAGLLVSVSQNTTNFEHFRYYENEPYKIVYFDRIGEPFPVSKVIVNDSQSVYTATNCLIDKGYKHIAYLGGSPNLIISLERYRGYSEALRDSNIEEKEDYVIMGGFQEIDGANGITQLLNLPKIPDAVVAVNDPVAIGVYSILKKRGLKIPSDMAVMGFSNNPITELVEPPLSTVGQPAYQMGVEATKLLIKQIKCEGKDYSPESIILETELILRGST